MASKSSQRVADALAAHGVDAPIQDMPDSTRTARDAAAAVGCEVSQIVKSLAFQGPGDKVLLVLAAGDSRVDEATLALHLGGEVRLADPTAVRNATGFAIGGVAPVGHTSPLPIYMDETLLLHDTVWAAAGTPRSVFPIDPQVLQRITQANVIGVRSGV